MPPKSSSNTPLPFEELPPLKGCPSKPVNEQCAKCMLLGHKDRQLIHEALSKSDGAVVHEVHSWIAVYSSCYDLRDQGKLTPALCQHLRRAEIRLRVNVADRRMQKLKDLQRCCQCAC